MVCITGDRGLCGGYNTYAIKKAEARASELKKAGVDFDMICIGKKGSTVRLPPPTLALPICTNTYTLAPSLYILIAVSTRTHCVRSPLVFLSVLASRLRQGVQCEPVFEKNISLCKYL